jgi:hypothetical protein
VSVVNFHCETEPANLLQYNILPEVPENPQTGLLCFNDKIFTTVHDGQISKILNHKFLKRTFFSQRLVNLRQCLWFLNTVKPWSTANQSARALAAQKSGH